MAAISWVGFAVFFVVSLSVGVRLVLLSRRTHELPELLIGIGVLGIGPVGFGLSVIADRALGDGGLRELGMGVALLAVGAGSLAKFVFNWRVYHPASRAAGAVVAAAGALLAGVFAAGVVKGFPSARVVSPENLMRTALLVAALLWGSFEALRWWQLMRRRQLLGLADPVVTNRFLLWGIAAFSAGFGAFVGTLATAAFGAAPDSPAILLSSSLHGLVAAVAMGLAFLPPRRYLEWLRAGARPAAA